jgi:hypothetical protein
MASCRSLSPGEDLRVSGIKLSAFTGISNPVDIKTLVEGTADCAVIDIDKIVCSFHMLIAAMKALNSLRREQMKTTSVMAEILYFLSPSTKINDAITHLAVTSSSSSIAIFSIDPTEQHTNHPAICNAVVGTEVPLNSILPPERGSEKYNEIVKFYKLAMAELQISSLEDAVATKLGVKEYVK